MVENDQESQFVGCENLGLDIVVFVFSQIDAGLQPLYIIKKAAYYGLFSGRPKYQDFWFSIQRCSRSPCNQPRFQ